MNNSYKIIVVGDACVGKTSIINTYMNKNIETNATIGAEYTKKYIDKYDITLHLWDCAGQERYRALCKIYFRNTYLCLLVFDLSNIKTFNSIKDYWLLKYLEICNESYKIILVGNKSDIKNTVDYKMITNFCKLYNLHYIETTIKNINTLNILFDKICSIIINNNELNNELNTDLNTDLNILDLNSNVNNDKSYNLLSTYC
tara:strand:- start:645 stop:1247 length:603 start_codon:yes stop_codon:yes gene_type:complete